MLVSTISHLRSWFQQFSASADWLHARRGRVTTKTQDRNICYKDLHGSLYSWWSVWLNNRRISAQTDCNCLREAGLHTHHPHTGLDLTAVWFRNTLGCAHSFWKLKTSLFFSGLSIQQKYPLLSICELFWTIGYFSVFPCLCRTMNCTELLWWNGTTFHKPPWISSFSQCEGDALHCRMQMVATHTTESVTLGQPLTVAGILQDNCWWKCLHFVAHWWFVRHEIFS